MNILPKKRWHVRTKENIARVRRDEAQAAEQARIEQARIDKAESEARINFLRNETRKRHDTVASNLIVNESEPTKSTKPSSKHINFFEELEQGNIDHTKTNKDFEKDKKEEQEKYEKQIGLLTYLGQGIKEAVSKSWYNELPKRINDPEKNIEVKPNKKALEDPMQDIKRYLNIISKKSKNKSEIKKESITRKHESIVKLETNKFVEKQIKSLPKEDQSKEEYKSHKKRKHMSSTDSGSSEDDCQSHKKRKIDSASDNTSSEDEYKSRKKRHKRKHKKHKKSKKQKREKDNVKPSIDIQQLRAERLKRENRERLRTQALLAKVKRTSNSAGNNSSVTVRQKYNSQFFPEIARQNCEKDYR